MPTFPRPKYNEFTWSFKHFVLDSARNHLSLSGPPPLLTPPPTYVPRVRDATEASQADDTLHRGLDGRLQRGSAGVEPYVLLHPVDANVDPALANHALHASSKRQRGRGRHIHKNHDTRSGEAYCVIIFALSCALSRTAVTAAFMTVAASSVLATMMATRLSVSCSRARAAVMLAALLGVKYTECPNSSCWPVQNGPMQHQAAESGIPRSQQQQQQQSSSETQCTMTALTTALVKQSMAASANSNSNNSNSASNIKQVQHQTAA